MPSKTEGFAQMAVFSITESAANTFTAVRLETAVGILERVAMVVHRLEYYLTTALGTLFNSAGDSSLVGVMVVNSAGNFAYTDPAVVDIARIQRDDLGTAASGLIEKQPIIIKDYSNLPNGGLIVPANPLYGCILGSGCAVAGALQIRLYYTLLQNLSPDEFWSLVQSRRLLTGT